MVRFCKRLLVAGVCSGLSAALAASVGCFPQSTKTDQRAQAADDPEKDRYATVGGKTIMGNTDPVPVSGVGLVYTLKGTGSSPQPGGWRDTLEKALQKQKVSAKEMLDDPARTTSLVLLSAAIPPGARKGDKMDVSITLPQGSKTTSLRGGVLWECDLTNYAFTGSIRQSLADSGYSGKAPQAQANELLQGSRLATAKGPLLAGVLVTPEQQAAERADKSPGEAADKEPELRVAKVWDGATVQIDRPYQFLLSDTASQPRLAMVIASRLNTVFHGSGDKAGKVAEAEVRGRPLVTAFVPPSYRLNHQRFLMVARQVTLTPVGPTDPYLAKLSQDLLSPETAVVAAVKLEALGSDGEAALRAGLESESAWVQFAAAQSLCYLGKADRRVAETLAKMADKHPALRTHCLTALASQDDAPCVGELVELMKRRDPALRYGAFVALRSANETHEAIRGRLMAGSFWVHAVAAESEPLVHLTTERRNEIVLFGDRWPLTGGFAFPLGDELTVTRKAGEPTVLISRVVTKDGEPTTVEGRYAADLGAVLKGVSEMSGTYSDAIEFIRRVNKAEALACPLAIDAAPHGFAIQELAQMARRDPTVGEADKLVAKAAGGADVQQTGGFDLANDADAVRKKPEPPAPPLNRNPGSILGR